MKKALFFGTVFTIATAWLSLQSGAEAGNLVLWNRLGSQAEVTNSEIGLDGTFLGGGFTQGVFGDAYTADYNQNNLVTFPYQVIPYQEGTLEFWAKLTAPPVTVPWGGVPIFVQIQNGDTAYTLGINGNDGQGGGGINGIANGFTTATSSYAKLWTYSNLLGGQPEGWHHYALVWDENGISGIDDGTRKLAIFLDGQLNSTRWSFPRGQNYQFVPLTGGTLGLNYVQDNPTDPRPPYRGSVAIDNLKIWDYAKTDFSDRFVENAGAGTVPEPSSTLSLLALGTLGAASTLKRKLKQK